MECIYCGNKYLYNLKENNIKCAKCKRKFSPQKLQKELQIIELFCKDTSAISISKALNTNYVTIKNKCDRYMALIAYYLENKYQQNTQETIAYGEYIYLEKSKKKDKKSILEAYDFITFDKGEIYNRLLDSLATFNYSFRYNEENQSYQDFNYFLLHSKISNITKTENKIIDFWNFFEKFILKYKGVSKKRFYYYLKLAEFYFNFDYESRVKILYQISIKN